MTTIDCTTCPVRGRHCDDCFVPVLAVGWPEQGEPRAAPRTVPLDRAEAAAVGAFVRAGLVSAREARGLRATADRPTWSAAAG